MTGDRRLIESDEFPFEFLSTLAERESWRKEVFRPIYHLHKWWAKRLGSVFRGILLGCELKDGGDLARAFYAPSTSRATLRVLDPFMGSGTTIGEAHKLGFVALGRDINPVACESVRVALGPLDRARLLKAFDTLDTNVGASIRALYDTDLGQGRTGQVLYFFWVKEVPCPSCSKNVSLFSNYTFARNAYPGRKPEVQVTCPHCSGITQALHTDERVTCSDCKARFDPRCGPAQGTNATCTNCDHQFAIASAVRASGRAPAHRLYAKLVLTPEGDKVYLRATAADIASFNAAAEQLDGEVAAGMIKLPVGELVDGHNTRQALGYNYRHWRDFFNARQLLALGRLQAGIAALPEGAERDALLLLFSGVLEFNNMFASYKGEGTGAVRHMFSHHVLKPERMPIEANVWGTPKSSGSFSGLFKTRLLRALDYRDAPSEVSIGGKGKALSASSSICRRPLEPWQTTSQAKPGSIRLSCGSSDSTHLPARSVDLVVTDPPFFDNVHYSELADFFFAWQVLQPRGFISTSAITTRHAAEVQDKSADAFSLKLRNVFRECHRVLVDDGLLVFTYHHSRDDGWSSLASAIFDAGFTVLKVHPVKAEMSGATPKSQAKDPILFDAVIVCGKEGRDRRPAVDARTATESAVRTATMQARRLANEGHEVTRNDCFVLLAATFFAALGPIGSGSDAGAAFLSQQSALREAADAIASKQDVKARRTPQLELYASTAKSNVAERGHASRR